MPESISCKITDDAIAEALKPDPTPEEQLRIELARFMTDIEGKPKGVRTLAIESYEWPAVMYDYTIGKPIRERLAPMLGYACKVPNRNWRRFQIMEVDKVVDDWIEVLIKMSMAHDKDESDEAEAQIDKILTPLLSARIAQIREFYDKLVQRMKADKRVPFMVWRTIEAWHDTFVKNASDEAVKVLRRDLAEQIANMVEEDVRPDLKEAMINALMWREPHQLEETKEALIEAKAKGVKPRVKGRQSCLFLEIPRDGKEPAKLML